MNYNIENNIDFYKELYTCLDNDNHEILDNNNHEILDNNNNNNNNDDDDYCLITNMPLVNNFVELQCGHKFNYGPLFKDVLNHKRKFNNMEHIKTKLKQNQIRCPYCRNIQDELLPYYENFGYSKEHGINFFDINNSNMNYCACINPVNQCQYQLVSHDISGNTHTTQCYYYGYVHNILKNKYNNENKYCFKHRLAIVKEIKDQDKIKKAKVIEEKIKMKKMLEEKKMELKNKKITLTSDTILDIKCCNVILKSGKFKGTPCCVTIYKNSLCKRHYNLQNKNINQHDIDTVDTVDNEENIVIG